MIQRFLRMLMVIGSILLLQSEVVSAAKVNFNPSTVSLTEGQSQVVQVTLDEPIICEEVGPPCQVSLTIGTNTPDRINIDTSPVIIDSSQWSQTFSFTVSAVDDLLDNGDITPIITIVNTSGSEYYNGFVPSFTINILDNDVTAPQIPAEASNTEGQTLAATGDNQISYLSCAVIILMMAIIFVFILQNSKKFLISSP